MLGYILFCVIIFFIAFFVSKQYKVDSFFSLPIVFCGITLLTYLLGMIDLLIVGVIVFAVLGIVSVVLLYRNRNEYSYSLNDIYPYVLFVAFAILFYVLNFNRKVWAGDDLYHWGLVAKNIFYWNKFCIEAPITIQYTHYPEISALPGYIALKLNGAWDEAVLFALHSLWGCVLLFPLFYRKARSEQRYRWLYDLVTVGVILFLPLFFSSRYTAYTCLQVDRLLGFAFAFCVMIAITEFSDEKIIFFVIGLATLAAIKETGMYLGIMAIVFYVLHRITDSKKVRLRETGILLSSAILPSIIWSVYLKMHNAFVFKRYKRKSLTVESLLSILNGDDELRSTSFWQGVRRLLTFSTFRLGANGSYTAWLIFFVISFVAVLIVCHKNIAKKTITFTVTTILFILFWWVGVLFVILFKFDDQQIRILSSFERYMDTLFIGILFSLLYFMFYELSFNERLERKGISAWKKSITFVSIVLALGLFTYRNIASNVNYILMDIPSTNLQRDAIETRIDESVKDNLVKEVDKVYVISCDENGARSADYYNCVFDLAPIPVNLDYSKNEPGYCRLSYLLSSIEQAEDYEEYITYYSVDDFSEVLQDYTYLLILSRNDWFDDSYSSMFLDGIVEDGFYKIVKDYDTVRFVKSGK